MATKTGPSGILYRIRIGLALGAAGALLAACGSSSKAASTGGTVTTGPSTPASSAASSKASSGGGSVNLGGGSFCDKARKAETDASSAATNLTDSPGSLKQLEENAHSELSQLVADAPSQIKAPVSTFVNAENQFFSALETANFDVTKVDTTALSSFDSPEVMQAIDKIDSYLEGTCGINPSAIPS